MRPPTRQDKETFRGPWQTRRIILFFVFSDFSVFSYIKRRGAGGLTGRVLERAEDFALRRHPLDVWVVLQGQQAAGRGLADVDQLEVAGEVGGRVLPRDDAPLQRVGGVPQGAADVQAAGFGREVPREADDVLCGGGEGRMVYFFRWTEQRLIGHRGRLQQDAALRSLGSRRGGTLQKMSPVRNPFPKSLRGTIEIR